MNVGIDIDGTITASPEFFSVLTKALKAAGHKVYILTFRDRNRYRVLTEVYLMQNDIDYDEIFMGEHEVNPELKKGWAEELDIDIIFEDNKDVLNAMPEGVQRIYIVPGGEKF